MQKIYSSNNPLYKKFLSLHKSKFRNKYNEFLVSYPKLISEFSKDFELKTLLSDKEENLNKNDSVQNKILMDKNLLKTVAGIKQRENLLVGVFAKKPLKKARLETNSLILDNVSDPRNVGAILRTALAFEVSEIILTDDCVDVYSPKVIDSLQTTQIYKYVTIAKRKEIIALAKKNNISLIATTVDKNARNNIELNNEKKFAIIVGNEGHGLSSELLNASNNSLYLNISSRVNSLGAASAAAIIIYKYLKNV